MILLIMIAGGGRSAGGSWNPEEQVEEVQLKMAQIVPEEVEVPK